MHKIGKLFHRSTLTIMMILLALVLAAPSGSVGAQTGAPMSDDFNMCSLKPGWTFENPGSITGATPTFTTPYTGDSHMTLSVPAGQVVTFSGSGQNAPRVMQSINDASFEVEARFAAPMNTPDDNWKIVGLLVRDDSGATTKWLRLDFNARQNGLNGYVGFLNGSNFSHIVPVFDLVGSNPTSGHFTIRVNYAQATGDWTVTWMTSNSATADVRTFNETALGTTFTPTDIGIFVGSTNGSGATPAAAPGNTVKVDYFHNLATPVTDDAIVLNVSTAGTGQGTVNRACAGGNQVNLTAVPAAGSSFASWSGDATGTNPTTSVTMTQSRNVVATFNQGGSTSIKIYMPVISR